MCKNCRKTGIERIKVTFLLGNIYIIHTHQWTVISPHALFTSCVTRRCQYFCPSFLFSAKRVKPWPRSDISRQSKRMDVGYRYYRLLKFFFFAMELTSYKPMQLRLVHTTIIYLILFLGSIFVVVSIFNSYELFNRFSDISIHYLRKN